MKCLGELDAALQDSLTYTKESYPLAHVSALHQLVVSQVG
jgi:hypothetical protein